MNTIKEIAIKILIAVIVIAMIPVNYSVAYVDPIPKIWYNYNIVKEEKIIEDNKIAMVKEEVEAVKKAVITKAIVVGESAITTEKEVSRSIEKRNKYSQEDLILLSKLINCEAGSDWLTDEHQQLVAMVALNRVTSDKFPNSISEVIYQSGQYSCVGSSKWNEEPSKRAVKNAKLALAGNVYCPENVLFQAEFTQGNGVYKSFYNENTGSYTYFCYGN